MAVRAKFRVESIVPEGNLKTIVLRAVYSPDPDHENRQYWEATPSGELRLNIVNEAASAQLELGAEYYLDITRAE